MRRTVAAFALASVMVVGACGSGTQRVTAGPRVAPTTLSGGFRYDPEVITHPRVSVLSTVGANSVTLPNVTGMSQDRAQTLLAQLGLPSAVRYLPSTHAAPGTVLIEMPHAGSSVPGGSMVTLVVSSGP